MPRRCLNCDNTGSVCFVLVRIHGISLPSLPRKQLKRPSVPAISTRSNRLLRVHTGIAYVVTSEELGDALVPGLQGACSLLSVLLCNALRISSLGSYCVWLLMLMALHINHRYDFSQIAKRESCSGCMGPCFGSAQPRTSGLMLHLFHLSSSSS